MEKKYRITNVKDGQRLKVNDVFSIKDNWLKEKCVYTKDYGKFQAYDKKGVWGRHYGYKSLTEIIKVIEMYYDIEEITEELKVTLNIPKELSNGEKFNIVDKRGEKINYCPFHFKESSLIDCEGDSSETELGSLVNGNCKIQPIKPKTKVTIEQVAEKFGVDVDGIEIADRNKR